MTRRPHKYGAKRIEVGGCSFASKAEAKRYGELRLLEKSGQICRLRVQPEFKLFGRGGSLVCKYRADFAYIERRSDGSTKDIVEDVKGYRKGVAYQMYRLKAKLFADNYGFEITEVANV